MFRPLIDTFNYFKCNQNYKKKLEELHSRRNTAPIRVCFLIRENQKWSYQSLYELLDKSEDFEPVVLISLLWLSHIGKDPTRNNLVDNYNFFKERGMNVQYAYENGKYLDLRNFKPDIVFYDQQWDLPKIHQPTSVSEFALTCYVPYAFELTNSKEHYTSTFHRILYRFFVENKESLERYKNYNVGDYRNCLITGYPKLESYINKNITDKPKCWQDSKNFKIIYAPHHSFERKGLGLATFRKNGTDILNFAKTHPDISWVFKPHPRFKYALFRNKIMTSEEIDCYYNEWKKIGYIADTGDYFDIFKTSDLLITDSISFLAEYMTTSKPIIRLGNNVDVFNSVGKELSNCYYTAIFKQDLENLIVSILNGQDYLKNKREVFSKKYIISNFSASNNIYNELLNTIRRQDV